MKPTSPEVSKSASLSSHHDKDVMDAFWDTLSKVDDTTGSTTAGLALEGRQEEGVQQQETIQERYRTEEVERGEMMVNVVEGALIYCYLDQLCQQVEDVQEKEKGWKKFEERFKELEKKRD
ncbi:hypothetical protein Dimus_026805 [Dionaea muscipula]